MTERHPPRSVDIAAVTRESFPLLWPVLEPVIREGASYPLPLDLSYSGAEAYWFAPDHEVFAARAGDEILGTYYLRANQRGGGAHIANAGFMTAPAARGQGIARAMAAHALGAAQHRGFAAMQFNFVVSANTRAVALWQSLGFTIIGTIPEGFLLPDGHLADVFIMHRKLRRPP